MTHRRHITHKELCELHNCQYIEEKCPGCLVAEDMHPKLVYTPPFKEESWLILGDAIPSQGIRLGKLAYRRVGTPGSVEFDWKLVFMEADKHNLIGLMHTHPSGMPTMSQRDKDTMTAWVNCLGFPLICAIECDEAVAAWQFFQRRSGGQVSRHECSAVRFGKQLVIVEY